MSGAENRRDSGVVELCNVELGQSAVCGLALAGLVGEILIALK